MRIATLYDDKKLGDLTLSYLRQLRAHDHASYVHSLRVSHRAMKTAERLGMSEEEVHLVGLSGLLHDVGKLYVPRHVLQKFHIDHQGWWFILQHPERGYTTLRYDYPKEVALTALSHHRLQPDPYPQKYTPLNHFEERVVQLVADADKIDATRTRHYR